MSEYTESISSQTVEFCAPSTKIRPRLEIGGTSIGSATSSTESFQSSGEKSAANPSMTPLLTNMSTKARQGQQDKSSLTEVTFKIQESLGDIAKVLRAGFKEIVQQRLTQSDDIDSEIKDSEDKDSENDMESTDDVKEDREMCSDHDSNHGKDDDRADDDQGSSKAHVSVHKDCPILPFLDQIIPKSKECNHQRFYAREDTSYAVEYLNENQSAHREKIGRNPNFSPVTPATGVLECDILQSRYNQKPSISLVRINSKAVLYTLSQWVTMFLRDGSSSVTCARPFRALLYYRQDMKARLQEIEKYCAVAQHQSSEKWPALNTSAEESRKNGSASNNLKFDTLSKILCSHLGVYSGAEDILTELRCYVDFVDEILMPKYNLLQQNCVSLKLQILFYDLWYLFRVGELAFVPEPPDKATSKSFQHIRRIYGITDTNHTTEFHTARLEGGSCKAYVPPRSDSAEIVIYSYHLDHDGKEYSVVASEMRIEQYFGVKEISGLPIYPLRCCPDSQVILEDAIQVGKTFIEITEKRYAFHSGWTLITDPLGCPIHDEKNNLLRSPEHLEGDIIIDLMEAFNSHPFWKPKASPILNFEGSKVLSLDYDESIRPSGVNPYPRTFMLNDSIVDILLQEKFLQSAEHFLGPTKSRPIPTNDDLALLPRRIFAYAVWARRFVPIRVDCVQVHNRAGGERRDNAMIKDSFDRLQVDIKSKSFIESLIHSHFRKKSMENRGLKVETQDLIHGKGKGVVILLHGVPGVGKTATAEAVAQRWGKPLFPITCRDLGFTPESVQAELEEIFRLAHLWDCILLLDEANVFITQRERNDLQRNALVSGTFPYYNAPPLKVCHRRANVIPVFLRMLEYYNGILFLTTNRAGVLDEAIKSRVHLSLRYDSLDEEQTVEIFKINIERLDEIEKQRSKDEGREFVICESEIIKFARHHFHTMPPANRWNGRQIRNAFLLASSLAHHEAESDPRRQKQLRGGHSVEVQNTTLLYDQFRHSTIGGADSDNAFKRRERDDAFQPPGTAQPNSGYGGPQYHAASTTPLPKVPQQVPIENSINRSLIHSPQAASGPIMNSTGPGNGRTFQGLHMNATGNSNINPTPLPMINYSDQSNYHSQTQYDFGWQQSAGSDN